MFHSLDPLGLSWVDRPSSGWRQPAVAPTTQGSTVADSIPVPVPLCGPFDLLPGFTSAFR